MGHIVVAEALVLVFLLLCTAQAVADRRIIYRQHVIAMAALLLPFTLNHLTKLVRGPLVSKSCAFA
eukprot:scaffold160654_cov20-Prasinocladus_malaysianus.AAC.1